MSQREQRVELDPLLSPEEMCRDAGISMATWRRNWRHRLPIVRISPRRIGVRRSVWRAALEQLIEGLLEMERAAVPGGADNGRTNYSRRLPALGEVQK